MKASGGQSATRAAEIRVLEEVLPSVSCRQWTFSLPKALRVFLTTSTRWSDIAAPFGVVDNAGGRIEYYMFDLEHDLILGTVLRSCAFRMI